MIPYEIIRFELCSFLHPQHIAKLALVCKKWSDLLDEEMMNHLLKRDFGYSYGDYKTLWNNRIEYQTFKGIEIWKPRIGNIMLLQHGYVENIKVKVTKIIGDKVLLKGEKDIWIKFNRRMGRWESLSYPKLFTRIMSLVGHVIKHDIEENYLLQ